MVAPSFDHERCPCGRMGARESEEVAHGRMRCKCGLRELLLDAQRQVLEGKQRLLARFLQRTVEIDGSLASMAGLPISSAWVSVDPPLSARAPRPRMIATDNAVKAMTVSISFS